MAKSLLDSATDAALSGSAAPVVTGFAAPAPALGPKPVAAPTSLLGQATQSMKLDGSTDVNSAATPSFGATSAPRATNTAMQNPSASTTAAGSDSSDLSQFANVRSQYDSLFANQPETPGIAQWAQDTNGNWVSRLAHQDFSTQYQTNPMNAGTGEGGGLSGLSDAQNATIAAYNALSPEQQYEYNVYNDSDPRLATANGVGTSGTNTIYT